MESPPSSGWSGKHAVELYVRTYTTMLQSSGDIKIESLVQAHLGMGSVLHPLAASSQSDMGALLYAVRRLPAAISRCRHVIMGQSPQGFRAVLGADILSWQAVKAPARRRRWYHDGQDTLAVLIASASDIDDLVPTLVAYQIEWNKLHRALQDVGPSDHEARVAAGANEEDWRRLHEAWGEDFDANLAAIRREECRIVLRLIGGSHLGYARNASRWWLPIASAMEELGSRDAQIYFVSSNAHSLVNVLTGVARRIENEIVDWIAKGASSRRDTAEHPVTTGCITEPVRSSMHILKTSGCANGERSSRRQTASAISPRWAQALTRQPRFSCSRSWMHRPSTRGLDELMRRSFANPTHAFSTSTIPSARRPITSFARSRNKPRGWRVYMSSAKPRR
jgi:hypothetical protein